MSKYNSIIVDLPQNQISRITLNRPKQRNSLSAELRTELFQVLESNDLNKEISVTIIRGSGESFSAGYDLKRSDDDIDPYYSAGALGTGQDMLLMDVLRFGI